MPRATVEGGASDYTEGVPPDVAEEKPKPVKKPAAKPAAKARLLPADDDEDE